MATNPQGQAPRQWGLNVKRKRAECGLTIEKLAEHVEVSPMSIRRIEAGTQIPRLGLMIRLAQTLRVDTLDALFPYPDPWGRQ